MKDDDLPLLSVNGPTAKEINRMVRAVIGAAAALVGGGSHD